MISPVKKRIFCPKTTKFGPRLAFLVNLGQAMQVFLVPCWLVGWWLWRAGCISQDTYLLYIKYSWGPKSLQWQIDWWLFRGLSLRIFLRDLLGITLVFLKSELGQRQLSCCWSEKKKKLKLSKEFNTKFEEKTHTATKLIFRPKESSLWQSERSGRRSPANQHHKRQ